jgi:pimeloyl-ACP methyl ester carboxylesterase
MTSLIDTSTGPIAYDITGQGPAAPPHETIVLLASGAHDRHDFDELRTQLPPRFRTITLDWPSHGESPPGTGSLSAMRIADISEQAIEQLAPAGAIVLGNSVGGFAAARLAIRRPELVAGLVIVDGGGFCAPSIRRSAIVTCARAPRRTFVHATQGSPRPVRSRA